MKKIEAIFVISLVTSTMLLVAITPVSAKPFLLERGLNYEIWQKDSTHFTWISAPPWVWDGSKFVPYIFEDSYEEEGYYLMRNAFITVKLYDDHAEFWDVDLTEVRVQEEKWLAQYNEKGWITLNKSKPKFNINTNSSGIFITQSWTLGYPINADNALSVTYVLREARPLKRFVNLINKGNNFYEFRLIQAWDGIAANKVKHDEGETTVTTSTNIHSLWFQFSSNTNDFVVFEDLHLTGYYDERYEYHNDVLQPTSLRITSKGMSASFTYYNPSTYMLGPSESLILDPETTVYGEYSKSGHIERERLYYWPPQPPGTAYASYTLLVGKMVTQNELEEDVYYWWRAYVSFDTSSIPSGATIQDVELSLYLWYVQIEHEPGIEGEASKVEIYSGQNEWTSLTTSAWGSCTTFEDDMWIEPDQSNQYYEFDVDNDSVAKGSGTQRTQFELRHYDEVTPPGYAGNEIDRWAFENPYSGGNPPNLWIQYTT